MIYWFTGQPGAGKTTLANELIERLENTIHIDGDNLRDVLKNFEYNEKGRIKNISNVITLARFLDHKNFNVVISVVAPYRNLRESLKETNEVVEIYVHTKNERGRENYFAKDYEKPLKDFIDMDTSRKNIKECVDILLNIVKKKVDDVSKLKLKNKKRKLSNTL